MPRAAHVPKPKSAIYDYIVRELTRTAHDLDEAPLNIVCEPLSVPGEASAGGTINMRLKAGTTPQEARTIASTLQARARACAIWRNRMKKRHATPSRQPHGACHM